jgi:hypothetical protein
LRKGDRATCLYRDGDVIITSWSDGRISWPRCRLIGHRGGSGLLVDDELVRAIRSESALALRYWFGVKATAVWRWRLAFGVEGHTGTEGSKRLIQANADKGGAVLRGKKRPRDQVERQQQTRRANGVPPPTGRWDGKGWTEEQLRLLGTMPDAEVAERTGKTETAVRVRRTKLGIAKSEEKRRKR